MSEHKNCPICGGTDLDVREYKGPFPDIQPPDDVRCNACGCEAELLVWDMRRADERGKMSELMIQCPSCNECALGTCNCPDDTALLTQARDALAGLGEMHIATGNMDKRLNPEYSGMGVGMYGSWIVCNADRSQHKVKAALQRAVDALAAINKRLGGGE